MWNYIELFSVSYYLFSLYSTLPVRVIKIVILGTYMRLISVGPEALTNTGQKQSYITGHQGSAEYNETSITDSGWKLIQ